MLNIKCSNLIEMLKEGLWLVSMNAAPTVRWWSIAWDQKVFKMSWFRSHLPKVLRLNHRSCILIFLADHTHPMLKVHKLWDDDENVDFVSFQEWCFMLLFRRLTKDFDMGMTDAQVKGLISALTKTNKNLSFHRFQILCNIFASKPHLNFFSTKTQTSWRSTQQRFSSTFAGPTWFCLKLGLPTPLRELHNFTSYILT